MRGPIAWFNLLLVLVFVGAGVATGAESGAEAPPKKPRKQKVMKTVRIYVETRHDIAERSLAANVGRSNPMAFQVEKLPILNEVHVEQAALIDEPGGFQVQLKFNSLGTRVLEAYTAAVVGRHLVIMTDIDGVARWIAAPLVRRRLPDGTLHFVPDASREEMERLVRGLNETISKNKKRWIN